MFLGMQHSGIGGGGFMLVRDPLGNYESIGNAGAQAIMRTSINLIQTFERLLQQQLLKICIKGI